MSQTYGVKFGELVSRVRAEKGMTQEYLAEKVFHDPARNEHVSKLEKGKIDNPQQTTIHKYVTALGLSEAELNAIKGELDKDRVTIVAENGLSTQVTSSTPYPNSSDALICASDKELLLELVARLQRNGSGFVKNNELKSAIMELVEQQKNWNQLLTDKKYVSSSIESATRELRLHDAESMLKSNIQKGLQSARSNSQLLQQNLVTQGKYIEACIEFEQLVYTVTGSKDIHIQEEVIQNLNWLERQVSFSVQAKKRLLEFSCRQIGWFKKLSSPVALIAAFQNIILSAEISKLKNLEGHTLVRAINTASKIAEKNCKLSKDCGNARVLGRTLRNKAILKAAEGQLIFAEKIRCGEQSDTHLLSSKSFTLSRHAFEEGIIAFREANDQAEVCRLEFEYHCRFLRAPPSVANFPTILDTFIHLDDLEAQSLLHRKKALHASGKIGETGSREAHLVSMIMLAENELTPITWMHNIVRENAFEAITILKEVAKTKDILRHPFKKHLNDTSKKAQDIFATHT